MLQQDSLEDLRQMAGFIVAKASKCCNEEECEQDLCKAAPCIWQAATQSVVGEVQGKQLQP